MAPAGCFLRGVLPRSRPQGHPWLLGFDGDSSLGHIMGERLLHEDMLARLGAEDRHQRVPMVGRGDRDGVDRRVIEHPPKIPLPVGRKRRIPRLLRQVGERAIDYRLIGSTTAAISTPGMAPKPARWLRPRPFTPRRAMRTRSFAPAIARVLRVPVNSSEPVVPEARRKTPASVICHYLHLLTSLPLKSLRRSN
jgi:hypothetical protein